MTLSTFPRFSENLELVQLGGNPTNLTGFSLQSQMRRHPDSSTAYDFTVGITSAVEGKITLSMTDATTSTIKPGRYVYDLMLTRPNTEKVIALEGQVLVRAGVSTGCP